MARPSKEGRAAFYISRSPSSGGFLSGAPDGQTYTAGFLHHPALNSRVSNGRLRRAASTPGATAGLRGMRMSISTETLKAMIRDYNGLELSDEELELVRPELESYFAELKKLEGLDLSGVFSGRLMHLPD